MKYGPHGEPVHLISMGAYIINIFHPLFEIQGEKLVYFTLKRQGAPFIKMEV